VTDWNTNNDVWAVPLKIVTAWKRRRDDPTQRLEATNLDVEEDDHVQEVSKILQKEVSSGHRLSSEETRLLKAEGFDLSRLNPGSTEFWKRPVQGHVAQWDAKTANEYPLSGEKIIYLAPRYRSKFSTKMTAYVWRNGRRHRFKVKLGMEVHPEIIVCRLRQHMGFFQDHMKHFPKLKMYLGDKSYPQWERDLQVKYGTEQLRRHVLRRGRDENSGEDWIVLRDVAIEARPISQVRVSAIDYGAYDGARSREVRSSALVYAFFAQGDHSTKNSREVLVQDEDGGYHVEHRMHDVGTALGRSPVLLRGPRDILNWPLTKNKPEEYDRNFVWADKDGNVSFIWNDYWHHYRDHSGATFADFKWAARLIASLTIGEITEAVIYAGIPAELVDSYVDHLTNMRNRAARAFWLKPGEETVPGRGQVQADVSGPPTDLVRDDGYKVIKKGKIVGNYYPNSTILPLLQETWFTKINSILMSRSFGRDIGRSYINNTIGPIARLNTKIGRTMWEREVPWTMTTFSIGIGINAVVARIVEPNRLYVPAEGRSRAYVVRDILSFSLGVNCPTVSSLLAKLGPELSASLQLYHRRFQHIHFSETVSEGYRSPIYVHKIIKTGNVESLAVSILTPGDVIQEYRAIGASTALHAGLGASLPYIGLASFGSSLSMEGGQTNWQTVTYTKDQVGSLHLLLERDIERTLGTQLEQLNVTAGPLVNAAAFSVGAHRVGLTSDVWNIEIAPKAYDLENATEGVFRCGPEAEDLVRTLKSLRVNPELALPENRIKNELPDNFKLRFRANALKKEARSTFQLGYLLNHDRRWEETDFKVATDDYEYKFFSKSRSKKGYAGIENTILDFDTTNFVVKEGTSKRLMVEMDRSNPRSLVVWVDVFDYHRTLRRKAMLELLDKLNERYNNPNDDDNFFSVPPVASVDPYRRIYANARIYVNGDKLLKLVQNSEPNTLWKQIRAADVHHHLGFRQRRKIKAALKELNRAVEALNRLSDDDTGRHTFKVQDRLATAALRLVDALYQSKFGVVFLEQLLDEDGMLVVAEVYGIHDQTNMLQDPDWVSRLRFSGKSWGKLTNQPPVSRFIRHDQPTPANEHAMLDIPMERFVGNIVTMMSGGWQGLGQR